MVLPLSASKACLQSFASKHVNGLTRQQGLFLFPEFVEVQRESFSRFLEKGIIQEFSKINPIWNKDNPSGVGVFLYPDRYLLLKPPFTVIEAIKKGKTYGCQLYLPATFILPGNSIYTTRSLVEVGERGVVGIKVQAREEVVEPLRHDREKRPLDKQSLPTLDVAGNVTESKKKVDAPPFKGGKPPLPHLPTPFQGVAPDRLEQKGERDESEIEQGVGVVGDVETHLPSPPHPLLLENPHALSLSAHPVPGMLRDGSLVVAKGLHWVAVGTLPLMTNRGHFVVNGVPRVLVNQITRTPGVYFHERVQEVSGEKKRYIYVDFICRRGAWLRIQTDKKEKVWAHLKRTRKIPLDFLAEGLSAFDTIASQQKASRRNSRSWSPYGLFSLPSSSVQDNKEELESGSEVNSLASLHSALISSPPKDIREGNAKAGATFLWQKFRNPRSYDLGKIGRRSLNRKLSLSVKSLQLTSQDLGAVYRYITRLQEEQIPVDDIDHLKNRRIRASGEVLQSQFETGLYRLEKVVSSNLSKLLTKALTVASLTPVDLFSTKPLNGALRELFGSSPLSQYMDQTNPLSEVTHKRRFSSLGPGGVSRDTAGMQVRGIHPTYYGRICPIETPEGKNAGLVSSPTLRARVNRDGVVEAPCYPVARGQVQRGEGIIFLSAEREAEEGVWMAPGDLQLSRSNLFKEGLLPVRIVERYQEGFHRDQRERVDCMAIAPSHILSAATALIPFLEHNDANRALMGSNMQRQAVPIVHPERPLVGTGLEATLVGESGHVLQSGASGYVSYVSGEKVTISGASGARAHLSDNSTRLACRQKGGMGALTNLFSRERGELSHDSMGGIGNANRLSFIETRGLLSLSLQSRERERADYTDLKWQKKGRQWAVKGVGSFAYTGHMTSSTFLLNSNSLSESGEATPFHFTPSTYLPREEGRPLISSLGQRSPLTWNGCQWVTPSKGVGEGGWASKGGRVERAGKKVMEPPPLSLLGPSFLRKGARKPPLSETTYPLQPYAGSNQRTCLIHRPSVSEGEWVQRGDLLADCAASYRGELAVGKNMMVAYLPWEGYNFEDAVVISERLVNQDIYTSVHIRRYEEQVKETDYGSEVITATLPGPPTRSTSGVDTDGLVRSGTWVKRGDVLVGKVTPIPPPVITPYERLAYDLAGLTIPTYRNTSLRITDEDEGRVVSREIIETTLPLLNNKHVVLRARVYVATRRRIRIGDKVSGRHGNKGIVSTILPREDMPYLPNGKPVDMVLNPLGVPSRMNVGQVMECLLGLAASHLGQRFKMTPFDEMYGPQASRSLVYLKLYQARLQSGYRWLFNPALPGKVRLMDGRTGLPFTQSVTVGQAYMLKLIHMVNDKIHSRTTGPYALVTRQPLGGKSNRGGQRMGEMEVWALEGFGAAYNLQEMLTSKSDDVVGRTKVMHAILKRKRLSLGTPEAFRVVARELQALCINLDVYTVPKASLKRKRKHADHLTSKQR